MIRKFWVYFGLCFLSVCQSNGQSNSDINPSLLTNYWGAYWIQHPNSSVFDYGVYHFRKEFALTDVPGKFIIHISADNRYKLYVNGRYIVCGPARGDLLNWNFETIDIAPYLVPENNVIAAVVWNYGSYKPLFQHSRQTAFILQGNEETESVLNTNSSWKVYHNKSYAPEIEGIKSLKTFMVVGPGEIITGNSYPWNWEQPFYNDSEWVDAKEFSPGFPKGTGTDLNWVLVPRMIDFLEMSDQRIKQMRRIEGFQDIKNFSKENVSTIVPRNQKVKILFDQEELTTAYPYLITSKGNGSKISLTYCESLYADDSIQLNLNALKGNRNEIENKKSLGQKDIFYPDGGFKRIFSPLWFRTYRYIEMEIETGDQDLKIEDFYGIFTAYPFKMKAKFDVKNDTLTDIWQTAWRTARLCAHETYEDCPYYEQLQYTGDTRIQALISLFVTGDNTLMKQAIEQFHQSLISEGLTQSRYPCNTPQIIPPFSLFWISMLHDYMIYQPDPEYIVDYLPGIESIIRWFEKHIDISTYLLGPMPYWNFVDWTDEWPWSEEERIGGVPAGASMNEGNGSIVTAQLAYTLLQAIEIMQWFGNHRVANEYKLLHEKIIHGLKKHCFSSEKNLFADTPLKKSYSQHANIMAYLGGASTDTTLLQRILSDDSLIQATLYYRFYMFRALKKAGLSNMYLYQLGPWNTMLSNGLTTFAEKPDPTRSDCHAWSASPLFDFLNIVGGIESSGPGFKEIIIAPKPGYLKEMNMTFPHHLGDVQIKLKISDPQKIDGEIVLPEKLSGEFHYKDQVIKLNDSKNKISIF